MVKPVPNDAAALDRVRAVLAARGAFVEMKMMGGLIFMVDGHMCCGLRQGLLMVRVGAEGRDRALALPHARRMEIGGRSLAGFIHVAVAGFATEADLLRWITLGLDFVATLPARAGTKRAGRKVRAGLLF